MKKVIAHRGRGFLSLVNTKPTSVAPPMARATGRRLAKPHESPWGTKYAIQYQARMPIHGRIRLAGIKYSQMSRNVMSRIGIWATLFHGGTGQRKIGCHEPVDTACASRHLSPRSGARDAVVHEL